MKKRLTQGYININILLVGIIVLGGFLFVGGRNIFRDIKKPVSPEQTYRIDDSSLAMNPEKSLQLDNFGFVALPTNTPTPTGVITPTPTLPPGVPSPTPTTPVRPPPPTPTPFVPDPNQPPFCGAYQPITSSCGCTNPWDPSLPSAPGYQCSDGHWCYEGSCDNIRDHPLGECEYVCVLKPVIYLYPTKKTKVDVILDIPGRVVVSDPLYPDEGWLDVEAYPDGTLFYQGKKYKELFFESDVQYAQEPSNGIVIPIYKIKEVLPNLLYRLGLNEFESKEFLDFWVPRLYGLEKPYILFSIYEDEIKEQFDKVIIDPEPDTRIEFIAYFKGLSVQLPIKPLQLSDIPPIRKGFTMVEWGGTIE